MLLSRILLIVFVFAILFGFLFFSRNSEKFDINKSFNKLQGDWSKIFPDGNRNAAGAKFFKYIIDLNLNHSEFLDMNKLYCSVSGSIVDPSAQPYFVYLDNAEKNEKVCGYYYACCWPCCCDLMKYARVIRQEMKFNDGNYQDYLLYIDNPCKKDIPSEINRSYFCNGNKMDKTQVYSIDDKLVIGVLHNARICNDNDIEMIDNDEITGEKCYERNSTSLNNLEYGMGDIFIKLAKK